MLTRRSLGPFRACSSPTGSGRNMQRTAQLANGVRAKHATDGGGPVRACWRDGRSLVTYPANPAQNAQDLTQNNSWLRCSLHAINRVIFHHLRKQVYVLWTALQGPAHLTKRRRSFGKIELPSSVTIFHIVGAFSSFVRPPHMSQSRRVLQLARRLPTRPRRAIRLPVTRPSSPLALGSGSAGLG